jgi:hypothetical protein
MNWPRRQQCKDKTEWAVGFDNWILEKDTEIFERYKRHCHSINQKASSKASPWSARGPAATHPS